MRHHTVRTLLGLAAAAIIAVLGGGCANPAAVQDDQGPHCGSEHIDRNAPVVSTNDVFIKAPPQTISSILFDVNAWPTWKADVPQAHRLDDGPLRVGSQFRWSNGGLDITSTVRAAEPDRCILWTGPANGIDGVHLWTITPGDGGTLVHTEESWSGAPVAADPAKAKTILDMGLAQGVGDLKKVAEATRH